MKPEIDELEGSEPSNGLTGISGLEARRLPSHFAQANVTSYRGLDLALGFTDLYFPQPNTHEGQRTQKQTEILLRFGTSSPLRRGRGRTTPEAKKRGQFFSEQLGFRWLALQGPLPPTKPDPDSSPTIKSKGPQRLVQVSSSSED